MSEAWPSVALREAHSCRRACPTCGKAPSRPCGAGRFAWFVGPNPGRFRSVRHRLEFPWFVSSRSSFPPT